MSRIKWMLGLSLLWSITNAQSPNILLIIADDLGIDALNGYKVGSLKPHTPTIDALRNSGICFTNVWSTPVCSATRAGIMSGKYGVNTGVTSAPGNLDTNHISIFRQISSLTNNRYAQSVVGKWHIAQPKNVHHPNWHGVDNYMGVIGAIWNAYDDWEKTENGFSENSSEYATSYFTNYSKDWIKQRSKPWFLWLAHLAPHTPIHVPPDSMFTQPSTNSRQKKYFAMIESLDYEIGRLLDSLPSNTRDSTLIIFLGDNGTPNNLLQEYPGDHGKQSLYQGGIHVPMIISGYGVNRVAAYDSSLINVVDIYATILDIIDKENNQIGIYNSLSFYHLLDSNKTNYLSRNYNYTEIEPNASDITTNGYTIRNNRYKLIQYADNSRELYDLWMDTLEVNDLLNGLVSDSILALKTNLKNEAIQIRMGWLCHDNIKNGDEEDIDCGGSLCEDCSVSIKNKGQNLFHVNYSQTSENILITALSNVKAIPWTVELYDLFGRKIYRSIEGFQNEMVSINKSGLTKQIVLLKITNNQGRSYTTKIYVN